MFGNYGLRYDKSDKKLKIVDKLTTIIDGQLYLFFTKKCIKGF